MKLSGGVFLPACQVGSEINVGGKVQKPFLHFKSDDKPEKTYYPLGEAGFFKVNTLLMLNPK